MTQTSNKIRTTAGRLAHDARPGRESLSKRLGRVAQQIKARDEHRCVYCGSDGAGAHLHLDHLQPRANGGADVATNLVVACRRCNTARKTLSLAQWAAYAAEVYGLQFTPRSDSRPSSAPAAGDCMILDLRNPPTARLLKLLRACYDDGNPPLLVAVLSPWTVSVLRRDCAEPSPAEQAHARGCVAAHNIEPL